MTDLCTCGDLLRDHQGPTGGCIYCACSVFDEVPVARPITKPPEPPAPTPPHACGPTCGRRAGLPTPRE